MTTFMEDYRPIFMVVTFAFLGLAFYFAYRPRGAANCKGGTGSSAVSQNRSRSKIMTLNKVMLWAVTVIAVVFLSFPQTVTNLFASNDGFTADMDRTVISIEGMT
ncbi:MAG: hypothetical protein CMJ64_04240 [Planctomycetaceae bacterium]|nr:hypothetical protein [Planctomycetaceae bacterium]